MAIPPCDCANRRRQRHQQHTKCAESFWHYWEHLIVVCISVSLAQLWAAYTVNKMTLASERLGVPKPRDSILTLVLVSVVAMLLMLFAGLPMHLPVAGFRVPVV